MARIRALFSRFAARQAEWLLTTCAALLLIRPWPVSTHKAAIVTTVGSSSSPGLALGSKIGEDSLVRDCRVVVVLDPDGILLRFFAAPAGEASLSDGVGSVVDDGLRLLEGLEKSL